MPLYKRFYLISKDKLLVVKKYINKHFNKGFIYPSIFLTAAPIFLAKKPGGGIQFYINYKGCNRLPHPAYRPVSPAYHPVLDMY